VVLGITAGAILLKQSYVDMGRFGMGAADASVAQSDPRTTQGAIDLGSLAPVGFTSLATTETYTADNLYEKIDGKATFYLDCQFEKLLTQRLANADNQDQWMEVLVYDMGNIRDAFSVYSRQRRPEAQPLADMKFAYQAENALCLVHGQYYVELVGSSQSAELLEAMMKVARKVQTDLPTRRQTAIPELSLFPGENLVPTSAKLYLSDAFGCEGLTDTFVAWYQDGELTVTAFFSRRDNAQDAHAVADKYRNFLVEGGATTKPTTNETLKNLSAKTFDVYGTTEIVGVIGSFMAGVHEADSQQAAERIAEMLFEQLSQAANE
jgi:hypothetical protein